MLGSYHKDSLEYINGKGVSQVHYEVVERQHRVE